MFVKHVKFVISLYQTLSSPFDHSLGTRLWMGLSDPIIIGAISMPVILILSIIVLLRVRKKQRNRQKSTADIIDVI